MPPAPQDGVDGLLGVGIGAVDVVIMIGTVLGAVSGTGVGAAVVVARVGGLLGAELGSAVNDAVVVNAGNRVV